MEAPQRGPDPRKSSTTVTRGALVGLLVGLVIGVIFLDNIGVGIALGIALAVAGGVLVSARDTNPKR
jgi:uncharacterized membrane protein